MSFLDTLFGGSESTTNPGTVYQPQEQFLLDLWNRAQQTSQDTMGTDYSQMFLDPSQQGFNQMLQGGMQIPGLQESLMGFGTQQNEALAGATQAGLNQINQNLTQNLLPSISQGSALAGTSGGSRQGIAEGLAVSDANQQATDFVNQMYSDNWGQQMQNQLGAYDQLGGLQGQMNQSLMGGLGMSPELMNLGFGSQYGNLASYGELIGSPTVLGGGGSSDSSNGIFDSISLF